MDQVTTVELLEKSHTFTTAVCPPWRLASSVRGLLQLVAVRDSGSSAGRAAIVIAIIIVPALIIMVVIVAGVVKRGWVVRRVLGMRVTCDRGRNRRHQGPHEPLQFVIVDTAKANAVGVFLVWLLLVRVRIRVLCRGRRR